MNKKQTRTLLIFYVLSAYVFLQFVWWAYYLVDLNQTILQLRLESSGSDIGAQEFVELHQKKLWMILGEGAVFISFLAIGIYKVQSNLKKESKLALLQQNFLHSVTHEIKSPIASIKLYLETLLKRNPDENHRKSILEKALQDSDRLDALSDKILLAARIESRSEAFQSERVNLSEFVEITLAQLKNSIGRDHTTNLQIEENLYVNSDLQAAYSILSNLYENAIKYSPKGSQVDVVLKSMGDSVELAIADLGSGIPDSEKTKVFEKFYRPGNENTRTNKGTGLGLYIVNELAQLMQLEIEVKDNAPSGTIMIIKFERK